MCVCARQLWSRSSCFSGTHTLVSDCLGASEEIIQSGTDQEDAPPFKKTQTHPNSFSRSEEKHSDLANNYSHNEGERESLYVGVYGGLGVWEKDKQRLKERGNNFNNDSNLIYAVHEGGCWLEILTLQHFPFHTRNSHLIKLAISSSRDTTGIGIWLNQGWHDHQRPNHLPEARGSFAYYQWVVLY